jgi:hypothetical protein
MNSAKYRIQENFQRIKLRFSCKVDDFNLNWPLFRCHSERSAESLLPAKARTPEISRRFALRSSE